MFSKTAATPSNSSATDHVGGAPGSPSLDKVADGALSPTDEALKALSVTVEELRQQTAPLFSRLGEQAAALAHRSSDAVRDGSSHLRDKVRDQAVRASDRTVGYIRDEPVKSVLIAAATGAALMALVNLMARARR